MSVNGYGLGRLHSPDARDHKYLLRTLTAPTRPLRTIHHPMFSKWLDQGATGTCVGHGFRHLLTGYPQPMAHPAPSAFAIYDRAIQLDEWADNDRDTARQFGTSVRAGAKVLQELGLISAYGWAFDLDTALAWLSWHGPLVIGTNWYDSMFERGRDGYLRIPPGARVAGGHCTLVVGIDVKRGAVRGLTSWRDWGYWWLSFEDFARLIREDGECCSPTETQHRVTP